jgi:hypothetical protein
MDHGSSNNFAFYISHISFIEKARGPDLKWQVLKDESLKIVNCKLKIATPKGGA